MPTIRDFKFKDAIQMRRKEWAHVAGMLTLISTRVEEDGDPNGELDEIRQALSMINRLMVTSIGKKPTAKLVLAQIEAHVAWCDAQKKEIDDIDVIAAAEAILKGDADL